ncbi:MAG TPA: hypothetical protein VGU44_02060 [Gammaproteobacteria bacterium]|nr:hypothetical protein [Gammaproteobacteria bacterium]
MLRKYTSFFDSSLEYLDDGNLEEEGLLPAYENALKICDHFVNLIRDISFIPYQLRNTRTEDDGYMQEIRARLEASSGDMGMSGLGEDDDAVKFEEAARRVYRLETVLRYPWESDWDGHTKRRELHLDINFFEKQAKQPYYRIEFWFSNSGGDLYMDYWGEWPAPEKSEESEKTE